jgi:hypothetical protein
VANDTAGQARGPHWLRWCNIGLGAAALFWLSLEDTGWSVIAVGAALAVLLAVNVGVSRLPRRAALRLTITVIGGAVGAGTSLAAALLMLLKNALHAHIFLDYPFSLVAATLARLPAWAAAGALAGLGLALVFGPRYASSSEAPLSERPDPS